MQAFRSSLPQDIRLKEIIDDATKPDGAMPIGTETIRGIEYNVFKGGPQTLREYTDIALGHGDADFLVYEDERFTFTQTWRRAAGFAQSLVNDLGVKKGDRIAIAMRNYPEYVMAFLATVGIGCVVVPVNAWWKTDEYEFGLSDSGAKIVICDRERIKQLEPLVDKLGLTLIGVRADDVVTGQTRKWDDVANEADAFPDVDVHADDDATIFYTSGSTGNPKGVVSTHRGVLTTLLNWTIIGMARQAIDAEEAAAAGDAPAADAAAPEQAAAIATVPLFHVTGSHANFLMGILVGRKLVFMYKWDAGKALQLIEQERISTFTGVPTMSWELSQHPDREKYDLSSLKDLGSGGAARPPEHVKELAKTFPDKSSGNGYGLTETNAIGAVNGGESYKLKPSSCGMPVYPMCEIKLITLEGEDVTGTGDGEVWIKSAANFRCYWNNEPATREAITPDGWFRTGDVGRMDEDGYLYIVDRIKDIVIRGGENISCIEVEAAIYEHPAVNECAVYGVPDERLGEKLVCTVMTKPGMSLTMEELTAHMAERVAKFKIPALMEFTTENLPRGATDKIYKRGLREEMTARLAAE